MHGMNRGRWLLMVAAIVTACWVSDVVGAKPEVVSVEPANGATDVDPATTELRIVFNTSMDRRGYSICGGGPTFPELNGKPKWIDRKTLVVKVNLKPNQAYSMSLNCPSGKNFRSAGGQSLDPVPWTFTTGAPRATSAAAGDKPDKKDAKPNVVEMSPPAGAMAVDPALTEMRVVFDQEMNRGGFSFCGGGPSFPELVGRPRWIDSRTVVMTVKLKPNHKYSLSLNCSNATNFRSASGKALDPVPWTFTTGASGVVDSGQEEADPPKVVEISPALGAIDVEPGTSELRVVFDRDMSTGGFSFCGGGPAFPAFDGRPSWVDKRTVVVQVKLEPDHDYQLMLNCPAAQNFRSAQGVPLVPVPWHFATAGGAASLAPAEQRALNERCLNQLMVVLRDYYSYYKLRGIDWEALVDKHRVAIVSAKSTRAWVKAVAEMLAPAEDMHLWLRYKAAASYPDQRQVRRNFDLDGVRAAMPSLRQRNECAYTARTDDGIGYILITTLSHERANELAEVPGYVKEMADCRGMIVDLRCNGGGSEPLAEPIAAWFVDGTKTYAMHVTRDPSAPGGFREPYHRQITGNKRPDRYEGPVAVLSGPGVMSSAEAFLLMMKQGEKVTVFGQASRGSSGNPQQYDLENGVEVFVPSWKAMRPDGRCFEGEGIAPDVPVRARMSRFKQGDPVIERALEHLRGQAG